MKNKGILFSTAILTCFCFTSCGGGSSGSDDDNQAGDPTITLYAPQTLKNVVLTLSQQARLQFSPTVRNSPEMESGTFAYTNDSQANAFPQTITNGTYSYQIVTANEAILTLTGGTGSSTSTTTQIWLGNLTGSTARLDFSENSGPVSFKVNAEIFHFNTTLEVSGEVTINGAPLPLNYNGNNSTTITNPFVVTSLNGSTYTFVDKNGSNRTVRFTETATTIGNEQGTVVELNVPAGDTPALSGYYRYTPDRSGGNSSLLLFENTAYGASIGVTLEFAPGNQGTMTSNQAPFNGPATPFGLSQQ